MQHRIFSTYRVQLRPEFGFAEAAEIAEYLADLGITHLYSSPYLQAVRGSAHGYDVIDHSRVNEELGGAAAHQRLLGTLERHGLGQVLDIVPNHMAIAERRNIWWRDVLENGPASRWARYFDVDWAPPQQRLQDKVLLPILGDHYGRILEAGEFRLLRRYGKFEIHYFDHQMPVAPRSLDDLLRRAAERCGSDELAFLSDACGELPHASQDRDRESRARRHRDKEVIASHLARLCEESPEVAEAIDAVVAEINADPDQLDALLARQNYRPAFWRTAGRELDYRRFFDVHTLVGLRMEDERVFADTHALVLDWVRRGALHGLRIDHPDGLRDPLEYFQRLRAAAPDSWIVVEKILEPGERLPDNWPVDGTTGYDFMNLAGGLLVDPAGEAPLTDLYVQVTGASADWPQLVREKKLMVLRELLASDVNRLGEVFMQVCERHRRYRDFTRFELREVVRELAADFPVYRTYVRVAQNEVGEQDVHFVEEAFERLRQHRPDLPADLFEFFHDLLLLRLRGEAGGPEEELVMRFQQLTGPAMAKGVEDTAFYNFHRLVALNEVGGDPGRFSIALEDFHRDCARVRERWPRTQLATSTHDTKRSEDVRARLYLLSEIPEKWGTAVRSWSQKAERHGPPDRNTEYLLWQTLVGAWPIGADRVKAYMEKATREAKAFTAWTRIDEAWEEALRNFIDAVLEDQEITAAIEDFVAPLVEPGRLNSLALTLLRLTCPGIPDTYQGSELWDLSLVDPDNRRPVDYGLRRQLLGELKKGLTPEQILDRADEGLPKLWLLRQGLHLRRRLPDAFGPQGEYRPLQATGARAEHAIAFARGGEVVSIAPRLVLGLGGDWGDTTLELPDGIWRNELTGDEVEGGERRLGEILARFPVALLTRGGDRVS